MRQAVNIVSVPISNFVAAGPGTGSNRLTAALLEVNAAAGMDAGFAVSSEYTAVGRGHIGPDNRL